MLLSGDSPIISPMRAISALTTCTIAVAFLSMLLQAYMESQNLGRIMAMASGLARLEREEDALTVRQLRPRVAVAYGSCSDLYVHVTGFLNFTEEAAAGAERPGDIASELDVAQSFGYYFARGAAAERYTSNTPMFRALVERLTNSGLTRSDLGGNAPVMGHRFHLEGAEVLIGAQMTNDLRRNLPAAIRIAGPTVDYDDVHLIVEYQTGDRWGPHTAPRANRYILHNDLNNPTLHALDAFGAQLATFAPRLLVISGLQMMDSYPFAGGSRQRAARLQEVAAQMAAQPLAETLVHVEMASFVEPAFVRQLFDQVLPYADSLGMNEQELEAMVQFARFGNLSRASESNPRIGSTLTGMRTLFGHLRQLEERRGPVAGARRTSRIHVHTLAFQAIVVEKSAGWRRTRNAAAKAALTAYRTVCRSSIVNPESAALVLDDSFSTGRGVVDGGTEEMERVWWDAAEPVACWTEKTEAIGSAVPAMELEWCVAPVLVCRVARQTAGAGDNISAAGLILQI